MNTDSMSIGKVAHRVAVGVERLRFYEREGLLEKPPRLNSGYRAYPAATVNRVLFIKRAKELGFSLKEIKELLALRLAPGTTCGHVKKCAEARSKSPDGLSTIETPSCDLGNYFA